MYTKKTYRKPSGQLFPNRWPLSYPTQYQKIDRDRKMQTDCKQSLRIGKIRVFLKMDVREETKIANKNKLKTKNNRI